MCLVQIFDQIFYIWLGIQNVILHIEFLTVIETASFFDL
jgi:hypothetical protein